MAISAISPITTPPVFIQPLAQLISRNGATPFDSTFSNTLSAIAGAPAAPQAPSAQSRAVASLEQTLFNQWLSSLQSAAAGTLGSSLDTLLAGSLGITGPVGNGLSALPFDTSNPQALLLTARLASLFNAVDLLGGDVGQSTQLGSLLDILA
jgi:hypothetical protein